MNVLDYFFFLLNLPLDNKLDLITGTENLSEFGCSEAVRSPERDSFWQSCDVQVLGIHLKLRVWHLHRLRQAQSLRWKRLYNILQNI